MQTIEITANTLSETIKQLQDVTGGSLDRDIKEQIVTLNSELASGEIRAMQLKGGISFIQFDVTFSDDVKLVFNMPEKSAVNFTYCSQGQLSHTFNTKSNCIELDTFKTGILSNIYKKQNILYFDKDVQTKATIISVNTLYGDAEHFPINDKLRTRFIENADEDIAYISTPNLKIAQRIKQLRNIKQNGVVKTLLIEGLVNIILALEIEQHKQDQKKKRHFTGSLTSKEMEDVKELSEYINNFPETSLTVTELAHKIGLTPSKLQEGFKLMHGRTVNDYIREVRVTKSEELIKTTDMNISQILYTLGFSSRSYFSKIFKQKYNCSPSEYKAQSKVVISA